MCTYNDDDDDDLKQHHLYSTLDDKILLLKTPHTLSTACEKENQIGIARKPSPIWLAFIVVGGAPKAADGE